MYKDLNNIVYNLISTNDILLNNLDTIPKQLLRNMENASFDEDELLDFFYHNTNYNIIGAHFTRLFDYEIEDIRVNGLHSDETASYTKKINALPTCFDEYKRELLDYVSNPKNKQSDGNIYFDIGNIAVTDDNEIFTENWGGETLYNYYDNCYNSSNRLQILKALLQQQTHPCVIVIRVNAYTFFTQYALIDDWLSKLKDKDIAQYRNEHLAEQNDVTVVSIIKID